MAREDCEVTIFIRTPNLCIPMRQRKINEHGTLQTIEDASEETFREASDTSTGIIVHGVPDTNFWDVTEEQREARLEELWQLGGFAWLAGTWSETMMTDEKVNK